MRLSVAAHWLEVLSSMEKRKFGQCAFGVFVELLFIWTIRVLHVTLNFRKQFVKFLIQLF